MLIVVWLQVTNETDGAVYCLAHAHKHVQRKKNVKSFKLFYRYSQVSAALLTTALNPQALINTRFYSELIIKTLILFLFSERIIDDFRALQNKGLRAKLESQ